MTQNAKLRAYFEANPNEWLPMPALAQVITETGICAAVHSRVADLRKAGLAIENRVSKNDRTGLTISEYKFSPILTPIPTV